MLLPHRVASRWNISSRQLFFRSEIQLNHGWYPVSDTLATKKDSTMKACASTCATPCTRVRRRRFAHWVFGAQSCYSVAKSQNGKCLSHSVFGQVQLCVGRFVIGAFYAGERCGGILSGIATQIFTRRRQVGDHRAGRGRRGGSYGRSAVSPRLVHGLAGGT